MKCIFAFFLFFFNLMLVAMVVYFYLSLSSLNRNLYSSHGSVTLNSSQSNQVHLSPYGPRHQVFEEANSHNTSSSSEPFQFATGSRWEAFRHQLVSQLRSALMQFNSAFAKSENVYGVEYPSFRLSPKVLLPQDLVCQLSQTTKPHLASSWFLNQHSKPFSTLNLAHHFPKKPWVAKKVKSCAIVASSGSLLHSKLGPFIDQHDIILRFNDAPTKGFEADVGQKTHIRIVNSQVISKPSFDFLTSLLYQNLTLLGWDPCNYTANLNEWYEHPDFPVFEPYFQRRKLHPQEKFFLLNPKQLWVLWDFVQHYTPFRIPPNPPSSGFLGLALLLPHCDYVDLFEFVPSTRLTKRCHYYAPEEDLGCTLGQWHPLAAEKLFALKLNIASDQNVFQQGFIRIPGIPNLRCA